MFQCDWFLSVKATCVGVAMTKLQPLPLSHLVNNAHQSTWRSHAKFQPDWSFNLLLAAKTIPVGVTMTKLCPLPHPHVSTMFTWVF